MIEKRLVQWYAADAGVGLDIAEREIALTYVLRTLLDHGLLAQMAFKGGTALRKIYLGATGRFSLDLDFTATGETSPDTLILDVVALLHEQTHHGLTFTIADPDYYATADSCGAEVVYTHRWVAEGRFGLQISFRARPLLHITPMPLRHERYFDWLGIEPPQVPTLNLHELLGEKIRASVQRSRVRDLYDLYMLSHQPFERQLVRQIAVIKCWETGYAFDPAAFLASLAEDRFDWSDLARLIRSDRSVAPAHLVRSVQDSYRFLVDMTAEEAQLAADAYSRETELHRKMVAAIGSLRREGHSGE